MESRLPKGTKLTFMMNQSVYITGAIHSLIEEAIIGACLVSVMILIILGSPLGLVVDKTSDRRLPGRPRSAGVTPRREHPEQTQARPCLPIGRRSPRREEIVQAADPG